MMMASRSLRIVFDDTLRASREPRRDGRPADALAAENDTASRKIRSRNDIDKIVDTKRRILDHATVRLDTSPRLCGGILVAIPTAMPRRVDQQVQKLCRQTVVPLGPIVVRLEIDGVLVDVRNRSSAIE